MERIDLIPHLQAHGCVLIPEGGNYSDHQNPPANRTSMVPRRREVSDRTANL